MAWRNWAELPEDVLSVVFEKLGAFKVLFPAQWVCRAWNRFSREPSLWRRVDMRMYLDMSGFMKAPLESIAMEAVNRSDGLLEGFYAERCGDDDLMRYIADRTSGLRCFHLISCDRISDKGLIEIASRFPLLEELNITRCSFTDDVYESVGRSCSQLKCFQFNNWYTWKKDIDIERDKGAFAIANTMHELRHLQLVENQLTNAGLSAIIDSCPHLETLDIRGCFKVKTDWDMRKKLSTIRSVRLPYDSIRDRKFFASFDADSGYYVSFP